jgi:hypothetical protein
LAALAVYTLFGFLLALVVVPTWGWTYWDFGDGNYMYIARRVREGVTLYRDILAPQPPLHTWAGVVAQSVGEAVGSSALIGTRAYCLLVRWLGGLMVMLVAWRAFGCLFQALVAAGLYLLLPIGFWWSLGYQSENLEIVFLLLAVWWLMEWSPRGAMLAGVAGALATHCNMTGLPFFLANAVFLACRRPRLLGWHVGGFAVVYTAIALVADVMTDGAFISNVLLNQVGTFPRTDILAMSAGDGPRSFAQYVMTKVPAEAAKVIDLEGPFIAAALVATALLVRDRMGAAAADADEAARAAWHRAEFLAWTLIAGLLSICFTAKGGTVNYIFVLGEPGVALFAGRALVVAGRALAPRGGEWRTLSLWNTGAFLRVLLPVVALGVMASPAWRNIGHTLREEQVELPERGVLAARVFIESYAQPGDVILAPPFYAFLTGTIVAGELAENYIWQIKYLNETFDMEHYGAPPGEAVAKVAELVGILERREAKVVLLDMGQTGRIAPVYTAIQQHYQRAEEQPLRTRNTTLELWVPRDVPLRHPPLFVRN